MWELTRMGLGSLVRDVQREVRERDAKRRRRAVNDVERPEVNTMQVLCAVVDRLKDNLPANDLRDRLAGLQEGEEANAWQDLGKCKDGRDAWSALANALDDVYSMQELQDRNAIQALRALSAL